MIIATRYHKILYTLKFLIFTAWFFVVGLQMGNTQEDDMKRADFQISVDAQPITFTAPPLLKDGVWLVHLESFAKRLGLKVEYPEGEKMAVLCGETESEFCVPLRFQDSKNGVVDINGVTYVQPTSITEPFGFEIYKVSSNRWEVLQPMHLAPEFTLPDLQGTQRHLRDFRGKKTLLYVWGSW
jgi:hypothetical protein